MSTVTDEPQTPTYGVSSHAIDLRAATKIQGQADSVVDVTWRCIDKDLEAELAHKNVVDPQLLLIVVHNGKETGRYVVPLAAEKWKISFRYSGENTVYAVPVWVGRDARHSAKKLLMSTNGGSYKIKLIETTDPELVRLRSELREIRDKMNGHSFDLIEAQDRLEYRAPEPVTLADDADEETTQQFEKQQRIATLEKELSILNGTYSEPAKEPTPEEVTELQVTIAEHEEAIAKLSEAREELRTQVDERESNPQNVAVLLPEFSFYSGDDYTTYKVDRARNTGELGVVIEAQMFAKNPGRLMKWLGTRNTWPTPAIDQCHLRKRAMTGAITFIPRGLYLGVAGSLAFMLDLVLVGWMKFWGMRAVNYTVLRHPLTYKPNRLWKDCHHNSSFWTHKINSDGTLSERAPVFYLLSLPFVTLVLILAALSYVVSQDQTLLRALGIMVASCFVGAIVGRPFIQGPLRTFLDFMDKKSKSRHEAKYQKQLANTRAEIEDMICEANPPKGNIALPRQRRLAYIWLDTKAKVCRPFQG